MKKKPKGIKAIGAVLIAISTLIIMFLLAFWWQPILWLITFPVPASSLYLGVNLWRYSPSSCRAFTYWAASTYWVFGIIYFAFKDSNAAYFLGIAILWAFTLLLIRQYIKKSLD